MRKAIIKEVHELNNKEVEMLLENDSIQDDIMDYVMEVEFLYINDMLNYIKPYLFDYSIDPYQYSYMKVSDDISFIYAINDLNNDYAILDDDMVNTLKLAIKAADDSSDCEMHNDAYYDALDYMSLYIKDISDYLINEFVSILEYCDSFEKVALESDYVQCYLENMYNRDCLIDNNKVTLI